MHVLWAITGKWWQAADSIWVCGVLIFPGWEGLAIKKERLGQGGGVEKQWWKGGRKKTTKQSHLSFSLLCTKRTFFSFTSFQLKRPALSSWTSFPFLESTSWPLVGALTTWNRRSSTLPSWSWTFRREKSSGFIEPIGRIREPFTWRLGVCILPEKQEPKGEACGAFPN